MIGILGQVIGIRGMHNDFREPIVRCFGRGKPPARDPSRSNAHAFPGGDYCKGVGSLSRRRGKFLPITS